MDQFAVGMGKAQKAIALDCASLKYDYVPLEMQGYKLVIANTIKKEDWLIPNTTNGEVNVMKQ